MPQFYYLSCHVASADQDCRNAVIFFAGNRQKKQGAYKSFCRERSSDGLRKKERGYLSVTPLLQPLVQCFLDTPRTIGTVFLFLEFFQSSNYRWRQCDVETLKALFLNTTARASTKFTHSIHLQHHYISVCQCTTKSELFGGYKWHKSP